LRWVLRHAPPASQLLCPPTHGADLAAFPEVGADRAAGRRQRVCHGPAPYHGDAVRFGRVRGLPWTYRKARPVTGSRHHLPDELLLAFASGTGDAGEELFVATHLTLCSRCRDEVETLEVIGGALLAADDDPGSEPVAPDPFLCVQERHRHEADMGLDLQPIESDGVLPSALFKLVGPAKDIAWTKKLCGRICYVELPFTHAGIPMRVVLFRQGQQVPMHSHRSQESIAYLTGSAIDLDTGVTYRRGDVSSHGPGESHGLEIDRGEDCIALAMSMRVIGHSLMSRLAFRLLGWS